MLFKKMLTALRGKATETGEAIVDSQALRIMDQEVRDAEKHLHEAKDQLRNMMGKRNIAMRKVDELTASINEREQQAVDALNKGQEALAQEVAERIAALESERQVEQANVDQYQKTVASLKATVDKSERDIKRIKQETSHVRATDAAQKAQAAVASQNVGHQASMSSAMASLERIKERQALDGEKHAIAEQQAAEASGADLDARLAKAGIGGASESTASSVMARLKAQQRDDQKAAE